MCCRVKEEKRQFNGALTSITLIISITHLPDSSNELSDPLFDFNQSINVTLTIAAGLAEAFPGLPARPALLLLLEPYQRSVQVANFLNRVLAPLVGTERGHFVQHVLYGNDNHGQTKIQFTLLKQWPSSELPRS